MRKKGSRPRRFTGIRPSRPSPVLQRLEAVCPECGKLVSYVENRNEAPVLVVNCTDCGIIFNRATGDVLSRNGAEKP